MGGMHGFGPVVVPGSDAVLPRAVGGDGRLRCPPLVGIERLGKGKRPRDPGGDGSRALPAGRPTTSAGSGARSERLLSQRDDRARRSGRVGRAVAGRRAGLRGVSTRSRRSATVRRSRPCTLSASRASRGSGPGDRVRVVRRRHLWSHPRPSLRARGRGRGDCDQGHRGAAGHRALCRADRARVLRLSLLSQTTCRCCRPRLVRIASPTTNPDAAPAARPMNWLRRRCFSRRGTPREAPSLAEDGLSPWRGNAPPAGR